MGASFGRNNITAWFSNYGYHDSAISLGLANNAIMRALSPGSSLTVVNHPLPYSIENLVSKKKKYSNVATARSKYPLQYYIWEQQCFNSLYKDVFVLQVKVMATGSSMGFQFAFNMGFCMAFVTAFLVLFVTKVS